MSSFNAIEPPHNAMFGQDPAMVDYIDRLVRRLNQTTFDLQAQADAISGQFTVRNSGKETVQRFYLYGRNADLEIVRADGANIAAIFQAVTDAAPGQTFQAIGRGLTKAFLANPQDKDVMSETTFGFVSNSIAGKLVPFETLPLTATLQAVGTFVGNIPDANGLIPFDLNIQFVRSTGGVV